MTAAIFIRGLLSDEHGIDFSKNEWVEGDINSAAMHGNPTILPTAKKLAISANKSGKVAEPDAGGRRAAGDHRHRHAGGVRPQSRYRCGSIQTTAPPRWSTTSAPRSFPIMHTVVIRRDVHEKNAFLASALYHAFEQSRRLALEKMKYRGTLRYMLPWMTAEIDEINAVSRRRSVALRRRGEPADFDRARALSRGAGRNRQGAAGRRSVRAGAANPGEDALGSTQAPAAAKGRA
jgi:4,5-dihydroxyphthalate decarboxylase